MTPFIYFDGVSFTYPGMKAEKKALDRVSFSVDAGEFVAIVGANGSGKSTLARLCNGLLLPDTGVISVGGHRLSRVSADAVWEVRRQVGMVFQHPDNQLVAATVEEDVAFGPENLGLSPSEIRRRVEASLATVGLTNLRQRQPHELSGGQKQLVAIAGVLAMEPRCVILDEATAMLDPGSAATVMATVHRLNRERGLTVLHITHRMEEVADAHRVLVLAEGRLMTVCSPSELFSLSHTLPAWGLDVPDAIRLADRLREHGWPLPPLSGGVEELVEALWQSASEV